MVANRRIWYVIIEVKDSKKVMCISLNKAASAVFFVCFELAEGKDYIMFFLKSIYKLLKYVLTNIKYMYII